jgi:hypothetical protein
MTTQDANDLLDHFASMKDTASSKALRDIDKLTAHLADLRTSVEAWTAGKPARTPDPYGNAFTDAATSVAAFREAAHAYGIIQSEIASS